MTEKETLQSDDSKKPKLLVPRLEAEEKIKNQIDKGRQIINKFIHSDRLFFANKEHRDKTKGECNKWSSYNIDLLKMLFSDNSKADGYAMIDVLLAANNKMPSDIRNRIEKDIAHLESIVERLELFPELTKISHAEQSIQTTDKENDEKSSQSLAHKTAKIALIAAMITLIGAIFTNPLWIPLIDKIFRDSGQRTKVPIESQKEPNSSVIIDQNALISKSLNDEKSLEPEEKEGDVNRTKQPPIFKIPEKVIAPDEINGEVNEPKKRELIKRREKAIEPEDQ